MRRASDGFGTLGPWDRVRVDGRRAWVVDRCATAAIALAVDATTDAHGGALGALWGGGDGASIAPGTPLSTERGAAVGVTTARQSEPAEHFGLGGGGGPRVKSLPDGRRCGALAAGWLERDDGSPWFVCWRGAGG